jgi:CubicO group peptidase (beta-lactamase class C family)
VLVSPGLAEPRAAPCLGRDSGRTPPDPRHGHDKAPADTFEDLARTSLEELASGNIPGGAVAVVKDDRVVFVKGFGVASIETGVPVTPDTLFQIGSTTKSSTAALALSLVEEGRLRLDDPIAEHVKGLAPGLSRVTMAQLLSHTAGLKDEPDEFGLQDESALGDYARSWTDAYCLFPPGQVFSYSNSGFALAGLVVQEVGGKPFADQMTEADPEASRNGAHDLPANSGDDLAARGGAQARGFEAGGRAPAPERRAPVAGRDPVFVRQ